MKALIIEKPGKLTMTGVPDIRPASNEIRIKVFAAGVNRADLLQKEGKYPPPPGITEIPGLEVAGQVSEVGEDCRRWAVGDRVFALLPGGGYAENAVVRESHAMPIPQGMDYNEAAGIAEVFITAYQSLFDLADLKSGESVLIHAGASGVGTAAVQLARAAGGRIAVTVGSDEKASFCRKIGAELAINYHTDPDFATRVINEMGGVDVLIDCIGGHYVDRNLTAMKTDARWVLLAFMGGRKVEIDLARILMKRIRWMGSTLRARDDGYKTKLIRDFSNRFLQNFEDRSLKPVIDRVFPWSEVEIAHKRMELNKNIGKIILQVIPE